jgi:hypothetical protein
MCLWGFSSPGLFFVYDKVDTKKKGRCLMQNRHDRALFWVCMVIAAIMGLSFLSKLFH